MLVASINPPTIETLQEAQKWADALEFRLDLYPALDWETLRPHLRKPVIVKGNLPLSWTPDYLDVGLDKPPATRAKIIRSLHYPEGCDDLEAAYTLLTAEPADLYKLCVYTHSTVEDLKLALFRRDKLTCFGMGPYSLVSRLLAPWVYGVVDTGHALAPGQLSLQDMRTLYRYGEPLALYGLLGESVSHSIGHLYHNKGPSRYVKMAVPPYELREVIALCRALGFRGLSVTMPHKEAVIASVDYLHTAIGAVNTLHVTEQGVHGYNTDAAGALDSLEEKGPVQGKRMVVLGAGGAARAFISEALKRGADVWIYNRTLEKAARLAAHFHCRVGWPARPDSVINTTPVDWPDTFMPPGALIMDMARTPFAPRARARGWTVVPWEAMYNRQAELQREIWGI